MNTAQVAKSISSPADYTYELCSADYGLSLTSDTHLSHQLQ
jgi:hypothetical protein